MHFRDRGLAGHPAMSTARPHGTIGGCRSADIERDNIGTRCASAQQRTPALFPVLMALIDAHTATLRAGRAFMFSGSAGLVSADHISAR